MNLKRTVIWKSLSYHMRMSAAVAAGVAAATAVIVGALLVGESMRGSLRDMTLDRLGKFDEVLVADRFFRTKLADELQQTEGFEEYFTTVSPVMFFPSGSAERPDVTGLNTRRTANIQIVGAAKGFWDQATGGLEEIEISKRQVVLNEPLAKDLGVQVGERITLRLPAGDDIPPESTLAQKKGRVLGLTNLEIIKIIPAKGLGRFSLRANQSLPMIAFVSIDAVQERLEETDRCNALFVASSYEEPRKGGHEWLTANFSPSLADLGIRIRRHLLAADGNSTLDAHDNSETPLVFDYYSATSDRMILENQVADATQEATKQWDSQASITYLADSISATSDSVDADRLRVGIPYSMVTGIDNSPGFPYLPQGQQLAENEIVLNSITASRLGLSIGDSVTLHYLEPESSHGDSTLTRRDFTVREIVPLTTPTFPFDDFDERVFDTPPTRFNDPSLTPEVDGITDQDSIGDWKAPFPGYDRSRIGEPDELYWDNHRTTPRAFVSLSAGQQMWGSRFGRATSVTMPANGRTAKAIETQIASSLIEAKVCPEIGLGFQDVKRQGLAASSGTTPFDGLFLGLSFFIIIAAVILVSILFRLGIEQRYQDIGLLSALGLQRPAVASLFLREGLFVAVIGSLIGVPIGLAYGAAMIAGLRTWWVGAIGTQFLQTHITWLSPTVGMILGVAVSSSVIFTSIRQLKRRSIRSLLVGQVEEEKPSSKALNWVTYAAIISVVTALGVGFLGVQLSGEPQALAFIGSGGMLLVGLTGLAWNWLRRPAELKFTLIGLATSNARRNATRSGTTIGLVATASFLILAMSAMRLAPNEQGNAGFRWLGRSSTPVYGDLSTVETRMALFGDATLPGNAQIYSLRVKAGDDASCRNLYQSTQPQVYGMPQALIEHFDDDSATPFGWAKHATLPANSSNPWQLLNADSNGALPVVVDNNTAMYSLHWYGGVGAEYDVEYSDGQTIRVRVVGLLANSVLQGALVMNEERFKETFPKVSGYRLFLVDAPESDSDDSTPDDSTPDDSTPDDSTPDDSNSGESASIVSYLEDGLGEQGLDLISTTVILDDLLAVQNTYLSAFQSLGALGLIFGIFGLTAVQLRNVFERRRELALMRAQGFTKKRIGQLVFVEMFVLLIVGLTIGIVSALAAVFPHMVSAGVRPPFGALASWLGVILVTGIISGLVAVRRTISAPVVSALRGE